MPANLNDSQNHIMQLALETEHALEDIFISGFAGIRSSTVEKLSQLLTGYQTYGMKEGCSLLTQLIFLLNQRKGSLNPDIAEAMTAFSRLEFYLEHLKSRAEQE